VGRIKFGASYMNQYITCLISVGLIFVSCVQPSIASESKLSANSGNDSSSSAELKSLLINSTKNLESYRYSIDVVSEIIVEPKNLSNKSNLTEISHEEGAINLTGHALSLIQRSNETSKEYGMSSKTNELYLFNETLYTRDNNKWSQIREENVVRLVDLRNVIQKESYIINDSKIKLLGFKEVDGIECYWIKVEPDPKRLVFLLNKSDSLKENIDLDTLLSNNTLEWFSWITKDAHLLKKSDIKIALTVKAADLGLPVKDVENIRISSKISSLYNNYNQPIRINFSSDFKKAYPFPIKGNDVTIFGVIQEDNPIKGYGYSYGYPHDNKVVYIDAATKREKANLIDIDDRYYESEISRHSDRKFFIFTLPNNTLIKKIRFEPARSYGSSESPVIFDLRLDQLGSIRRHPIKKECFNASSDRISVNIYSLDQKESQYLSLGSLLVDIIIDLKVTNSGEDELSLNLDDFRLIDQFGWEYPVNEYESSLGLLLPGESRRFNLVIPHVSILSDPVTLKYKTLNIDIT